MRWVWSSACTVEVGVGKSTCTYSGWVWSSECAVRWVWSDGRCAYGSGRCGQVVSVVTRSDITSLASCHVTCPSPSRVMNSWSRSVCSRCSLCCLVTLSSWRPPCPLCRQPVRTWWTMQGASLPRLTCSLPVRRMALAPISRNNCSSPAMYVGY